MSNDTPESWRIAKARRQLQSAARAFDQGDWETTASRAYYAAYHAIVDLLERKTDLRIPRNHARLHNLLRAQALSALLDTEHIRDFGRLFQERQTADYEPDSLSRQRALDTLARARAIVTRVSEVR